MDKKTRLIIIGVLSIIIVILLSLGITKAFMKPVEQGGNLTEISLDSCAKIKLTGTSSINLSSSYPMSRNRGLQTTPYSLTVTSYCDSYVGFNLYIATLNTNTLTDENIHYILTEKGSKTAVVEGILSTATDGSSDFSDTDKTELNTGLKGTYGSIYKIHNTTVALKGNKQYDLYLFVDESSTNTSMNKTFKAGVAVKAYDRERNLAEYVISQYTGTQGENSLYYHNSSLTNGAGDNSYRYAGASESVNNFICFGSTTSPCPTDNLYRIIGVFGENNHGVTGKQLVKLIKYDYANSNLLGTDGDYTGPSASLDTNNYYKGSLTSIDTYFWNYEATNSASDEWSTSLLNKTNLNTNYLNNIGTTWSNLIEDTTWKVSGHTTSSVIPSEMYTGEITNATKTYGPSDGTSKIGLVYASDYGFAASPSAWTTTLNGNDANGTSINTINWMYMGHDEWTISPNSSDSDYVFLLDEGGGLEENSRGLASSNYGSRPVLYLKASVLYAGGLGTKDSPITLVV